MELVLNGHDITLVEVLLAVFTVLAVWLTWQLVNSREELRLLRQKASKAEYWEGDVQGKYEELRKGLSYLLTAADGEVCGTDRTDAYYLARVEDALLAQKKWREAEAAKASWSDLMPHYVSRADPEPNPDDEP